MLNHESNDYNSDYRGPARDDRQNNYQNKNSQSNDMDYQRNYQSEAYQREPYEATATEAERIQKEQNPTYLNPQGFEQDEYNQEGYYGQTQADPEDAKGKVPYTYAAYEGEKHVSEAKDSKFKILTEEALVWFQSFVSERPSSAAEVAKDSREPFAWTVFLGLFALIGALKGLFNSIGAGRNSGYVIGRFFAVMLISALIYFVNVLVIYIAQNSNKTLKSWYQAFNTAVIPTLPILFAYTLNIIFGSFFNATMMTISGVITSAAVLFNVVLLNNILNKEFEGKKSREWKVLGLIILAVFVSNILAALVEVQPAGFAEFLNSLF